MKKKRADAEDAKVSTSDCSTISYTDFLLTKSEEVEKKFLATLLDTVYLKAKMTFSTIPAATLI